MGIRNMNHSCTTNTTALRLVLLALIVSSHSCYSLTSSVHHIIIPFRPRVATTQVFLNVRNNDECTTRRTVLLTTSLAFTFLCVPSANAEADDLTRGGVRLTPFNGLTFNYRGNSFGGLDASTVKEPSIPYSDFLAKLDAGEVEYVEFFAPYGDTAYATIKSSTDDEKGGGRSRIRIGEGYPIEQHDGWSSPAFVVKSVAKKKVPYKFIVPGLDAYK